MRIVIAPDKFKDCLSAAQVAAAIAEGVRRADPSIEIDLCPMADGGEGTVDALVAAMQGKIVNHKVTGPLSRMKVDAPIGLLGDENNTAVIEMSAASGLYLLKSDQRDPTRTTTYGTGELLREAANMGATRIILGIGGSATVDGGVGCAQAWGATFTLNNGVGYREGTRRLTGGDLIHLRSIPSNLPLETQNIEFIVACDVGNPLLGPDGAAPIFGPQKGATPEQIDLLEAGLQKLVDKTGRRDLADQPGAGAAGGLGFGMMAFFNASLKPGISIVMDAVKLRDRLKNADLCITGEGRLDAQSLAGKTAVGVSRLCKEMNIPCIALAGTVEIDPEKAREAGLTASFPISAAAATIEEAISGAARFLSDTAQSAVSLFLSR